MDAITDRFGNVYHRRKFETDFHDDLEKHVKDTKLSNSIYKSYKEIVHPHIEPKDELNFQSWIIDNINYLCGYAFDYKKFIAKSSSISHLSDQPFINEFFHKIRNAHGTMLRSYPEKGEPRRIPILYSSAGGGHKIPSLAIESFLKSKNKGAQYTPFMINIEEEAKQTDPLYLTGVKFNGIILTDDLVYTNIYQQKNDVDLARKFWKKIGELREYIPSEELANVDKKIKSIKPHMIIIAAHHKFEYVRLLYNNNVPGAILHTDYEFSAHIGARIKKLHRNICKIWVPINEKHLLSRQIGSLDQVNPLSLERKIQSLDAQHQTSFFSDMISKCTLNGQFDIEHHRKIRVVGYPVRLAFEPATDEKQIEIIREKKKIHPKAKVVLVSMGMHGAEGNTILRWLKNLINTENEYFFPIHYLFITGKNTETKKELENLLIDPSTKIHDKVKITVCGFLEEDELAEYMKIASVLLGKPGGSTSAECIKMGVSLLATESYYWEDANVTQLKMMGLGRRIKKTKPLVRQIIQTIESNQARAKNTGEKIVDWKEKIEKLISQETSRPVGKNLSQTRPVCVETQSI